MDKNRAGIRTFLIGKIFSLIGKPVYYLLVTLLTFIPIAVMVGSSLVLQIIKSVRGERRKLRRVIWNLKRKVSGLRIGWRWPKIPYPIWPKIRLKIWWCKLVNLVGSFIPRFSSRQITVMAVIIVLGSLFYVTILKDLPNPNSLLTRDQIVTTKIYDRHGELLFKIYKNENRSLVKLEEIPQQVKLATIAIEDANFYQHTGFSLRGILRALKRNLTEQKLQGGSTITQQLVKNALLTPEKTLRRKIKEVVLAFLVELHFSKDEILEMYFNEVGYGGAAYGIEEASQLYFHKSVKELNLAEAALLAGLPAAPTTYSPFGTQPELAIARQHEVLRRMVEEGFIETQQAEEAKATKLELAPQTTEIKAPHFVMYVKDLLVQKYGEAMVHQGGLEVITSLDLSIQEQAEKEVRKELDQIKNLRVSNGATLVTNPQTGEILAMVGSRDYFDTDNDGQVNVTLRPRQPGSSIKPVNYSVALANGFTPATIIPDTPICYRILGQPAYCPKNYDGRFHGNITLRQALASSYNVPAVKTLSHIGVSNMVKQGQILGITTWDNPERFGLSLTLGGGEVKMVDMAVVYGTLANQGVRVDLQPILKIKNYQGKTVYEHECGLSGFDKLMEVAEVKAKTQKCSGTRVLDPMVAYQLTDILADNEARAAAFGLHSILNIADHQVAVKTGTTNNLRDNWTIGYTSDRLVAVWVGNNDNTPMSYVASGITGASPIWHNIMTKTLADQPAQVFSPPTGLLKVAVCTLTGTKACASCPSIREEYFLPGTEPKTACSNEQIDQILTKKEEENRDQALSGAATGQ